MLRPQMSSTNGDLDDEGGRGRTRSGLARDEQPGRPTTRGSSRQGKAQAYCICRKSHENGFMIACDECDEWFHGKCVNISAAQGRRMEKYVCPSCSEQRRKRGAALARHQRNNTTSNSNDDQDYEEADSQGDDEPLFSDDDDDDSDEWNEDEAYARAPWYDPDTDHVNVEEWKTAMALRGNAAQRAERAAASDDSDAEGDEEEEEEEGLPDEEEETHHYAAVDEDAASEDQEYQPARKRRTSIANGTVALRQGNGAKRKRTHAEGDEGEENEEDGGGGAGVDDRYRGCDGTTRAVRKRVVASLADALSFSVQSPSYSAQGEKPAANAAMVQSLAENIETEMWHMFEKHTSSAYKAKFRTLLFNLKDERNQELRESVLSGEMAPAELCKKTSKELAPTELAEWRKQRAEKYFNENVMITEEPGPIVKKTHKGEEILNAASGSPPTLEASTPAVALPAPTLSSSATTSMASASVSGDTAQARKKARLSPTRLARTESGGQEVSLGEDGIEEETGQTAFGHEGESEEPMIDINVDVSGPFNELDILSSASSSRISRSTTSQPPTTAHSALHAYESASSAIASSSSPRSSASSSLPSATSSLRPAPHVPGGGPIWRGCLVKANMENCDVVAHHLAGPHTASMQQLLPEELQVRGRVNLSKLSRYVVGLSVGSRHRTLSLFVLEPADEVSSVAYIAMLHYFGTKSRAGVVANLPSTVKEMYVVPITSDDVHFRDVMQLEEDKLIMVVVTDKEFVKP